MRVTGIALLLVALTGCASVPQASASPSTPAGPSATSFASTAIPSPSGRLVPSASTSPPSAAVPTPLPSGAYASAAIAAGALPWIDLPYRSPVDPDPLVHPAGTPPWCTTADVTLGKGGGGDGAGGFLFFSWPLLAKPGHRCSLQGYPLIRMSDPAHTWSLTSTDLVDFSVPAGGTVDEAHPGTLGFRWGHDDGGYGVDVGLGPRQVTFSLPHTGGTLTTIDRSTGWFPTKPVPAVPEHPGRLLAEAAYSAGPAIYAGVYSAGYSAGIQPSTIVTVKVGEPLVYRILLAGPAAVPTGGPACFGYRERLVNWKTGKLVAEETHELNCAALAELPVYGRLFEMRMTLPQALRPGTPLAVEWMSDAGSSPAATSANVDLVNNA